MTVWGVCALLISVSVIILGTSIYVVPDNNGLAAVLSAISTTMLATGLITAIFEWWTVKRRNERMSDAIDSSLRNHLSIYQAVSSAGISGVYPNRDACSLDERIRRAKSLKILQTFEPTLDQFEKPILEMLSNGGRFEFLYLDPTSEFGKSRERQFGNKIVFKDKVRDNLRALAAMGDGVTIREYAELTPVHMFIVDDEIFFGVFWVGDHARNNLQFQVSPGESALWNELMDHYRWFAKDNSSLVRPLQKIEQFS